MRILVVEDERNLAAQDLVAALCCFTRVLVILLGVVGLSALVGYLGYVLLPALGFFILVIVYALWPRRSIASLAQ